MPVRNKSLKQNWCLNNLAWIICGGKWPRIKVEIILPWKAPVLIKSSLFHFEQFPDGLARERQIEAQSYIPVHLTEIFYLQNKISTWWANRIFAKQEHI